MGNTLYAIAVGAIVLGIAHALESIMFEVLKMDPTTIELVHRITVFIGFVMLIIGFQQLAKLSNTT